VPATGAHEVVIDTPDHDLRMSEFPVSHLETVLEVYQERVKTLSQLPGVKCITLFRNDGSAAGASQTHPHSQILALPVVPAALSEEIERAERHLRTTSSCLTCQAIVAAREEHRVVLENAAFVAMTAYAARYSYETWIVPRAHGHDFRRCEDLGPLAEALSQVLRGLEAVEGSLPFNLILQTAPVESAAAGAFHWRLEVLPRATVPSGLELGSGMFIVSVSPECAAAGLRDAIALASACAGLDGTGRPFAG
jgi:UDPglucose--hexose-1-phosphate uridylyltransferase